MEILYVIVGGACVVAGFFLAKLEPRKPAEKLPEAKEPAPLDLAPEELPKSGQPIGEQVDAILGYNPYQALKNGDK